MHSVHLWYSSAPLQMTLLKSSYCSAFSTCLPITVLWERKIKRHVLAISKLLQYMDLWKQWLCLVMFSGWKKGTVDGICSVILAWTKPVLHETSGNVTGQEVGAQLWTINGRQCTQSSVLVQAPTVSHYLRWVIAALLFRVWCFSQSTLLKPVLRGWADPVQLFFLFQVVSACSFTARIHKGHWVQPIILLRTASKITP